MTKPIRPQDVGAAKAVVIPSAVFDAFNAEIAQMFSGGEARVNQDAVMARLEGHGFKRSEILLSGWLNVEEAYREAGWEVRYEKPGYNEPGGRWFTFTARAAGSASVQQEK